MSASKLQFDGQGLGLLGVLLVRGTIVLEGASVGTYDNWSGVDVAGNDSAYVELGNLEVTAYDGDADLTLNNFRSSNGNIMVDGGSRDVVRVARGRDVREVAGDVAP